MPRRTYARNTRPIHRGEQAKGRHKLDASRAIAGPTAASRAERREGARDRAEQMDDAE